MKRLFNLVAIILCISGALHLAKVISSDQNAIVAVILTAVFGLAYLVIGILMFRTPERMLWPGAVIPFVGLLITLIGMKPNPDRYIIAFIVLDILVVAACVYLLFKGRTPIHRVS